MHMFCVACELDTTEVAHYKTKLHAVNLKRRLAGYTPLAQAELESVARPGELVVDLHHNYDTDSEDTATARRRTEAKENHSKQQAAIDRYLQMGMNREQITYILKKQCYVCYERFATEAFLFEHIEAGTHRAVFTDGTSLYLENGTVLNPSRRNLETQISVRNEGPKAEPEKLDAAYGEFLDQKRLNDLKCSLHVNRSFAKRPF